MPRSYKTLHRYPAFYGIRQFDGVDFIYNYNVVYASSAFETAFFGYLNSLAATPEPIPTVYQRQYNAQLKKRPGVIIDDCGAEDQFYLAWGGDESDSIMHYLALSNGFGQFDRDNMGRNMTAAYINQSNDLLAKIYARPRAGQVSLQIMQADALAGSALAKYASMGYVAGASDARLAFQKLLQAADRINVQIEPQSYQADYKAKAISPKFVDGVGYPRQHMHQF